MRPPRETDPLPTPVILGTIPAWVPAVVLVSEPVGPDPEPELPVEFPSEDDVEDGEELTCAAAMLIVKVPLLYLHHDHNKINVLKH